MRLITGIAFIVNIGIWIAAAIFFIANGNFLLGTIPLFGFMGFLIAYGVSEGMVISVSDYFFSPQWVVFKKKLKWANGIGITISIVVYAIIEAIYGNG